MNTLKWIARMTLWLFLYGCTGEIVGGVNEPTEQLTGTLINTWKSKAPSASFTTSSFAADANTLLVIAANYTGTSSSAAGMITISSEPSLTWTKHVEKTSTPSNAGLSNAIFTAPIGSQPTPMSVTVSIVSDSPIVVDWYVHAESFRGYDTANPVGATGSATASVGKGCSSSWSFNLSAPPLSTSKVLAELYLNQDSTCVSPGKGFTGMAETLCNDGVMHIEVTSTGASPTQTVAYEAGGSDSNVGVAVEIRAAVCTPDSNAAFCKRLGNLNCGSVTAIDNCGVTRTKVDCGSCTSPQTCGGGGTANICGGGGSGGGGGGTSCESDAAFCIRLGGDCGSLSGTDTCGGAKTVADCASARGLSCTSPNFCKHNNCHTYLAATDPARKVADFLVDTKYLGRSNGAIVDEVAGGTVNEDSNMEYALMGVAAMYDATHEAKYLTALENGIDWLGKTAQLASGPGNYYSYWIAYGESGAPADQSAKGIDATNALFVHLLYLHKKVTRTSPYWTSGSTTKVDAYAARAKSLLDFDLANNWANGLSLSSWVQSGSTYKMWPYEYASDQGDTWLGMQAGCDLYGVSSYCDAANSLKTQVHTVFTGTFNDSPRPTNSPRYSVGRYGRCNSATDTCDSGSVNVLEQTLVCDGDWSEDNQADGPFANSYLLWMWGDENWQANADAYNWLKQCATNTTWGGEFHCWPGGVFPRSYAIPAALYVAYAKRTGKPTSEWQSVYNWLTGSSMLMSYGGVREFDDQSSEGSAGTSNGNGFVLLGLLGASAK
jgi:hypothetical protein